MQVKLGLWLKKQRQQYREGTLKPERLQQLQELVDQGYFKWELSDGRKLKAIESAKDSVKMNRKWLYNFYILHGYGVLEGGNPGCCNIHEKGVLYNDFDGALIKIGLWLFRQRRLHAGGHLREDRVVMMQALVKKGWFCMNPVQVSHSLPPSLPHPADSSLPLSLPHTVCLLLWSPRRGSPAASPAARRAT
jgi:hypothetical protein